MRVAHADSDTHAATGSGQLALAPMMTAQEHAASSIKHACTPCSVREVPDPAGSAAECDCAASSSVASAACSSGVSEQKGWGAEGKDADHCVEHRSNGRSTDTDGNLSTKIRPELTTNSARARSDHVAVDQISDHVTESVSEAVVGALSRVLRDRSVVSQPGDGMLLQVQVRTRTLATMHVPMHTHAHDACACTALART